MKNTFLAFIFIGTIAVFGVRSLAQVSNAETIDGRADIAPTDFENRIATIQFMNYMNYVVNVLSSYRNVFVLEEEYKNLSDNRLNLDRVDSDVLEAIKTMLDTIYSMRANDKEREWFMGKLNQDRQRRQHDILVGIMKNTTGLAVDAASQNWNAVVTGIAGTVGNAYSDWANLQQTLERENNEIQFTYDRKKEDQLHEQNKKQLDVQFVLMNKYNIGDQYRFTRDNAKSLVEAVKASNPKRVYTRLRSMKENLPSCDQFPMFWKHYAWFSLAAGHPDEALDACDHFDVVNQHSIFRCDPMAAQVAMTRVSAMIALGKVDVNAVHRALKTIEAYNYDGTDVDMAYFCASTYYSLLGDTESALKTLDALKDVLEERARDDLIGYRDLFAKEELTAPWATPPVMIDLMRCHVLQKVIADSIPDGDFHKTLESILENSNSSSIEKLFFVGDVRVRDLWKQARPDVEAIHLRYEKHDIKANSLVALVPISWFALGDYPIRLDLLKEKNVVGSIDEVIKERKIALDRTVGDQTFARIEMKCPTSLIKGVDDYVLRLRHKSWPVAVHFRPPVAVDVHNAKFKDDVTDFIPTRVEFMNGKFPMSGGDSTANAELFHVQLKNVVIPKELLRAAVSEKGLQAALVDSKLYVEVSRMGETIFRYVIGTVKPNENKEEFAVPTNEVATSFALMWRPGDRIVVSVKVAETEAFVEATKTSAGGIAGALAGAGIGAVGAGVCSGGLGAPAGALVGAAIGFFGGAGAGALVPVNGERTVISFVAPTDEFGLNGTLEKSVSFSKDSVVKASILLEGGQRQDSVAQGGLELQKKYIVRLRSVHLSSDAPKIQDNAAYYMLVSLYGEKKPLEIELPPLSANTTVPMEKTLVLLNAGGESKVEIRRKSIGPDALVFEAVQGPTNGSSWLFIGKAKSKLKGDNKSFVEFDTFPTEE